MAEVVLDFPAPPGSLFTDEVCQKFVGQDVPLTLGGREYGRGHVLGAEMTGHGRGMALRMIVADDLARFMGAIEAAHAFTFITSNPPARPLAREDLPKPGDFA